ncbi:Ceramide glucosyltransferase-B, partial [Fragariocoptes setiger]
ALYLLATLIVLFWCIIWIFHVTALINAKRKLHKHITYDTQSMSATLVSSQQNFSDNNNNLDALSYSILNQLDWHCSKPTILQQQQQQQRKQRLKYATIKTHPLPTDKSHDTSYHRIDFQAQAQKQHQHQPEPEPKPQAITSDSGRDDFRRSYDCCCRIDIRPPGVSIIKPLVGVDTNLYTNLESFFTQHYPLYEILFCVQDERDAAIGVVRRLMAQYPSVDAKLFVAARGVDHVIVYDQSSNRNNNNIREATAHPQQRPAPSVKCVNPKISNMLPAYEVAQYELLLVSDSSIKMKRDTLCDMVQHMSENVALVHQMPFVGPVVVGMDNFSALVERVYFGTAHARAYLAADLLGINCPTGMSALMRKRLLDQVGGIAAFGCYLAEDYFFAKSFTDRGWKISILATPIELFNQRISRWIKLRFAMVPVITMLEPLSECMMLGVLAAPSLCFIVNSAQQAYTLQPVWVFVCHTALWFALDAALFTIVQNGPMPFSKLAYVRAWLLRECSALLVYITALRNPDIEWRSRVFRLKWGGYAQEITTTTTNNSSNSRCIANSNSNSNGNIGKASVSNYSNNNHHNLNKLSNRKHWHNHSTDNQMSYDEQTATTTTTRARQLIGHKYSASI